MVNHVLCKLHIPYVYVHQYLYFKYSGEQCTTMYTQGNVTVMLKTYIFGSLKGLGHEIEFKYFDKNEQFSDK